MAGSNRADPSCELAFDSPRHKGHGKGTIKENEHAEVAAGSPSFSRFITAKTTHHSAYCCRLCLPRMFREEHSISDHVTDGCDGDEGMETAVPSATWGAELHHQQRLAYDHSLRMDDELVFTLMSPSIFHVAFAAAKRPMHPTRREGSGYPWKQNYHRLACLSSILLSKQLQENVVTASSTEEKETVEPDVCVLVNAADLKGQSSDEKYVNPPKERFCQCKTFMVGSMTHLERTNPDGSTYWVDIFTNRR